MLMLNLIQEDFTISTIVHTRTASKFFEKRNNVDINMDAKENTFYKFRKRANNADAKKNRQVNEDSILVFNFYYFCTKVLATIFFLA
jgi:hypothetical protein